MQNELQEDVRSLLKHIESLTGFNSEIAELEGLDKHKNSVRQLIIRVSDQLAAGEIKLTEYTKEESQAAKARLEEHRVKGSERYNRYNGDLETGLNHRV